jgi:hypothetical protein
VPISREAQVVIPAKKNTKIQRHYNRRLYKKAFNRMPFSPVKAVPTSLLGTSIYSKHENETQEQ